MLIFPGFTLALALAHTENGDLPLLVNLRARNGRGELPTGGTALPTYCRPPFKAQALTKNQSTWLKLPEECEGPHLRRAVPPTSTSTGSGVGAGCFSSPGTPGQGEERAQQLCQLQLLHPVLCPLLSWLTAAVLL